MTPSELVKWIEEIQKQIKFYEDDIVKTGKFLDALKQRAEFLIIDLKRISKGKS